MHVYGISLRSLRHGRGFTLIEILLSLAVVGVLVAVALPKYRSYRDRIDQSKAITDIRILQTVITDSYNSNGAYPASLADIGNGNLLDPWGRPYVYVNLTGVHGKGSARKDRKLNPINSDFDLYSVGKDGVSKSQLSQKDSLDDIVRANDGNFVGLASDFSQ